MNAVDTFADRIECLLPRRGRQPIAWIQNADVELSTNATHRVFADVAVTDWDAAAAVAEALHGISSLTRSDWLFRWRKTREAFRTIRVYPRR